MPKLDLFHKIITFPQIKEQEYTIDDIINDEPIVNFHNFKVGGDFIYHVNDRADSNRIVSFILQLLAKLPITDIDKQWESEEIAKREITKYFGKVMNNDKLLFYKALSENVGLLSQEQFLKLLVTEGMAVHLAEYNDEKEEWCVDLSYMSCYSVREGLLPYGAKLVMTPDFDVKYIELGYDLDNDNDKVSEGIKRYGVGETKWQMAYNVFTSSLITHVTIVDHAVRCHFILAGGMLSAVQENTMKLNSDLVRFIRPFLYRTGDINGAALDILINPGGIVSRLFSFTCQGLEQFFNDSYKKYSFIHPLERVDSRLKFYKDSKKLYDCIEQFVKEMISAIFPDEVNNISMFFLDINQKIPGIVDRSLSNYDNLVRIVTSHIYNVSMWHEQIGNVTWYLLNPKLIRVKPYISQSDAQMESEQNSIQNCFLALTTSIISMPKLNDQLWRTHRGKFKDIFCKFKKELDKLCFESDHFTVDLLECSVSL